ncbi:Uncharacterized membrane protein YheB, UPF0754 family [Geoalkalibacter ferrihydriticus]|uniref:DUF445 domain-containing protein n=2 Tax=Geoalkalibacter ferrihydriticus TaxID=392333 RepID=A0A0C2HYH3_9BACT|nr:DUF445 family protein [Geoalkalibacter ferrihydriticus]KIH77802.1 hypothetical protein GFER_03960 [Geoalkalibacter ferrihydriticus DSM 17813]SDL79983.1 Uncharacterized membrane protein YheB, UPF0754 family [Geoalkalibacter ferrihydriticus]
MTSGFESYLPYFLPPLLGAIIGYVTNYVAIRMLFRPLRAWRVLGVRIPMTPGIIPGKRHELAARMGEMVGSHLLTAEDVGRALEKDSFRREIKGAVADKLGRFLDRELGPLAQLVPADFRGRFRELVELLRWKLVKAVFAYLDSDAFETRLRDFVRRKGNEWLARDLESFLTPERYTRLRGHLDDRISGFLHSPGVARAVEQFIDAKTDEWVGSERTLRELLPADLIEVLLAQAEKEVPPLLEKFGGMLYDPDFRARLVIKGRQAIEGFLDSLGGLSGLLSGFINLDKLYERIPEFLDKAGDEIARWLKEEKTQAQVAQMLRERIDALLDRSLASYLEKVPYEKVAGVRRFVRGKAVEYVQSRRACDAALNLTERGIDRLKDRSFASLLDKTLPEGGLERGREELCERILAALRSPAAREVLSKVLEERLEEWLFRKSLGRLSARVPADVREELNEGLCRQLGELLKKEVPPLVETLNVQRMVEEKVNSLDLLKVEGLLMGIMKEQFKYINLFGALLGFFIGLANLLILGFR